jgi:hypothetical protein
MPRAPTRTQQIATLISEMMPFCPPNQREAAGLLLNGAPFVKLRPKPRGELFAKMISDAKGRCMDRHGPRYYLNQAAGCWGRLDKTLASYRSERGTPIKMPRDTFIPAAEFWPGGVLPAGIELATYQTIPEWRDLPKEKHTTLKRGEQDFQLMALAA